MDNLTPAYAVAFIATAFFVSMIFTRIFIAVGPRLGLMDEPDERRVHVTPVPRAGGLAIWVAFLIIKSVIGAMFESDSDPIAAAAAEAKKED